MSEHIKIYGIKPRIQYIADGSICEYEYPFAIFKPEDIKVYFGQKLQSPASYQVTIANEAQQGSVIFNNCPPPNTIITIIRDLKIERTTDFQEGSTLRAKALNHELDFQIACQQQIADNLNRSLVLPPYAVDTDIDLTLPTPEPGKAILWNAEGKNLENSTIKINEYEKTIHQYQIDTAEKAQQASANAEIARDQALKATEESQKAVLASQRADQSAQDIKTAVEGKLDCDLHNISSAGKAIISNYAMPGDKYINISLKGSGAAYDPAPADGIYVFSHQNAASNKEQWFENVSTSMQVCINTYNSDSKTSLVIPARKGDIVKLFYESNKTVIQFRFYYTEGSK